MQHGASAEGNTMVYSGHVKNGEIQLDNEVTLPEGAAVSVEVLSEPPAPSAGNGAPSLLERLGPVVGAAQELPDDAAANVDHYLYGHPRS